MGYLKFFVVIVSFISLFVCEHFFPLVKNSKNYYQRYIKNLSFLAVNAILSVAFILPLTFWVASFNVWGRGESNFLEIFLHVLLLDFWIFCWHRLMHYSDFLWRFHKVHHLDEQMDSSSGVRFHFGEVFLSAIARAPIIFILSIPFKDVLIFETLLLLCSLFQHSNIKIPVRLDKVISKLVVTPSIHWIHHSREGNDMNSNFCLFLSIWDRIFLTQAEKSKSTDQLQIGIKKEKDEGFLRLLLLPFRHFR